MKLRSGPSFGVLLLAMLWAIDWLLPDLLPHSGAAAASLALAQAILFSAFALLSFAIARTRRLAFPRRLAGASALVGLGLFVLPFTAAAFARGSISSFDQVALLCLTPVFAVVLEPYVHPDAPPQGKAALVGAVAAVAGVLCFFPLEAPDSLRAGIALVVFFATVLVLAATYGFAVRLARSTAGPSTPLMAAPAGATAALCFVVAASTSATWNPSGLSASSLWLLLIDLPGLFLLFWLMRRLTASRLTAAFLFAPLFAALAGLALERMLPPVRSLLGLALLAGGASWLLFAPAPPETEPIPSLTR
ncbi:MAG: hypothetical protein ACLGXA_19355 [Acidobacteriota bacterium]